MDTTVPVPKPRPLPKPKPKALNESSQLVNPEKLVQWARLRLDEEALDNALLNLCADAHVKARVPRIADIHAAVQDKLRDPTLQRVAEDHGLLRRELESLLACPPLLRAPSPSPRPRLASFPRRVGL
jgi:hypothetical protein